MILHTDGSGWWSKEKREVSVLTLETVFGAGGWGELRVHFDPGTWNVDEHGLIYTDDLFETEVRSLLESKGFPCDEVRYSEQGMQGDEFVSFDVGSDFVDAWRGKGLESGERLSV